MTIMRYSQNYWNAVENVFSSAWLKKIEQKRNESRTKRSETSSSALHLSKFK